ncbi:2-amino-4-hydroxy-6-hydroxymethyldihydropteridine diphosphokinase [Roseimaritima ulvae]|uniref:2-amino-4-hydroxy-6-hydroxymethyldihydropteridine pyrophosphokinase n=1 Tax=Roseimaritima ulvae TaxID=980254 RepID=A0A5B9QTT3_9BACT|nr:2-amino-4-hydroxy-6-hydroxymethyldihydropteridine diphosphokinase [Roseimaritima ulvae]QEG41160.1 Bifunctional folate synthesis protein [Roseimaritima ulvae]
MFECLVSLGSNLGDRRTLLVDAARRLAAHADVVDFRASRLYTTPPIGGPGGQEPFLNAVAAFRTPAAARDVLGWLQEIEQELGRQRKIRWDARSIDLDVVLYGDLTGGGSDLIVPHPRYTARLFVLLPACDVVPQWQDPRFGWTIERLTQHLQAAAPSLALVGGDVAVRNRLSQQVAEQLGIRWFAAPTLPATAALTANAPAHSGQYAGGTASELNIDVANDERWIAAAAPPLPSTAAGFDSGRNRWPRLVVRLQQTDAEHRWPAPHQIWPRGGDWPEYRLEIDDRQWALQELVSAFDSLQCSVEPASEDGNWYVE